MNFIDIDDQSMEVSKRIGANSTTGSHDTETNAENLEENPIRKKAKGVHIGKTWKIYWWRKAGHKARIGCC